MKPRNLFVLALVALFLPPLAAMGQEATPEATEEAASAVPPDLSALAEGEIELPDLGGRTVTIAVENAYPPFNFINTTSGEAVGWDYDVINALADRMNFVPEFVTTGWDGMIVAVSQGQYDMAADGITITEERDEIVDFSVGYIQLTQDLLARVDEDRFQTAAEFAADESLIIGSQPGTTNFELAVELVGEERVRGFDPFGVAVQALVVGDIDAVMIDNVAAQGYMGANPGLLKVLGDPLTSEELGFIFPNDSELRDAFNAGLASLAADGFLDEMFQKWFIDFDPNAGSAEATPEATAAS